MLVHAFLLSHILCPDNVALRGKFTGFSGEVEPWPLAPLLVRPGKKSFQ